MKLLRAGSGQFMQEFESASYYLGIITVTKVVNQAPLSVPAWSLVPSGGGSGFEAP